MKQKRTFKVTIIDGWNEMEGWLKVDQKVFDEVNDDWRNSFYQLHGVEAVVDYIAQPILLNGSRLSQIDGFAHLDDSLVEVLDYPDTYQDFFVKVEELEYPKETM